MVGRLADAASDAVEQALGRALGLARARRRLAGAGARTPVSAPATQLGAAARSRLARRRLRAHSSRALCSFVGHGAVYPSRALGRQPGCAAARGAGGW